MARIVAPEGYRTRRIHHYVRAVVERVDPFSEPPILIGHSMGAFVVQHVVTQLHLPGAVLLAPAPPFGVWNATWNLALHDTWSFVLANAGFDLKPLVRTPTQVRNLFFSEGANEDQIMRCARQLQGESWLAFVDMLFADLPVPQNANCPVWVIGAAKDQVFPSTIVARTAAAYNTSVIEVPNVGHDMMLDRHGSSALDALIELLRTR